MTVYIDIIGSLIIRATMVVIVLSLNVTLNNAMYERSSRVVLKERATYIADQMRADIANLGNGVESWYRPRLDGDTTYLWFVGDMDNNGSYEDVVYYLDSDATQPGSYIMYRVVGSGSPQEMGRSITSFGVTFYQLSGSVTSNSYYAKSFAVQFTMKSDKPVSYNVEPSKRVYPAYSWKMRFFPSQIY